MGIHVVFVVESLTPQAGAPVVWLHPLVKALAAHDVTGAVTDGDAVGRMEGCDVVHVLGWGYGQALRAVKTARRRGIPYVISPLGALTAGRYRRPDLRERIRRVWRGESALIRNAALLGAVNAHEASTLQGRGLNERVEVLTPGIDVTAYDAIRERISREDERATAETPPGSSEREHMLLVLGPIDPVGGGVPLLKAFAECGSSAEGWRIVFAGPEVGDWRKQMQAAVRRKGGADRVIFTEAADLDAQRTWLARAEAVACPALHPMCPTSVIQALAAGTPVLASRLVAPEMPNDAMIVCAPTRESIAGGLRTLLNMTPDERRTLGTRAREAARTRWDVSVVAAQWAGHYENIVGAPRASVVLASSGL